MKEMRMKKKRQSYQRRWVMKKKREGRKMRMKIMQSSPTWNFHSRHSSRTAVADYRRYTNA
jgi:hypothetical protein